MGARQRHDSSNTFLFILPAWVFCTCIASLSGSQFVQSSLDCLTPASIAQACTALLYLFQHRRRNLDSSQQSNHPGVVALGLLQLLSSILTIASFAFAGVTQTFIARAVEPVFTYALLCILHKRQSSARQLFLSAVVVGSVLCALCPELLPANVLLAGGKEAVQASPSSPDVDQHGQHINIALAWVAAAAVSCHGVVSKAMAAMTLQPEQDLLLQSSVPGLILSICLQVSVWAMLGVLPLEGLQQGTPEFTAALVPLMACALFQCAESVLSAQVLQRCSPVLHGTANSIRRVAVLVTCLMTTGAPLTGLQLLAVVAAQMAAAALSTDKAAARTVDFAESMPTAWEGWAPLPGASAGGYSSAHTTPPGSEGGADPSLLAISSMPGKGYVQASQLMARLAYFMASVIAAGTVSLMLILVAFHNPGGSKGLDKASLSFMVQGRGSSSSSSSVSWSAGQFAAMDVQRIKCLHALHDVSKASLAPLLNQTRGGIALFDVAVHINLGDAVLWAATARLVSEFHQSAKIICALSQYSNAESMRHFPKCNVSETVETIGNGGVVLLAPGGNWGDLWWPVQKKRVRYLQEMSQVVKTGDTSFKVVQLPQTINFSANKTAAFTDKTVNSMPPGMFTFFARSAGTLEYAEKHYPKAEVLQAPDMAWSLGPLMPGSPGVDVLFVLRRDKEAADSEHVVPQAMGNGTADNSDNGDGSSSQHELLEQQLGHQGISYVLRDWDFNRTSALNFTRETSKVALTQFAESRLQGAIEVVSLGKVVVTNRLHVAIMANLLGRPLIWIDTQQKKLSSVRSLAFSYNPTACTETNMHSKQVSSFAEAVATAAAWVSSPGFIWSTDQAADRLMEMQSSL